MDPKEEEKIVLNQKRKEYESKILQFMVKPEDATHNLIKERQNSSKPSQKREKLPTHKSTEQSTCQQEQKISIKRTENSKNSHAHEDDFSSKNSSTNRSKTLNRKSNLTSHSAIPQEQESSPNNHKHLLEKIESRINEMNKKISQQISNEQNALLKEYEIKLKSKQQELNKLRKITNQEMINEKTIQRKEQLKREKENLIEGNHYYDKKLQELKEEYGKLTQIRDNQRKNLQVVMIDQGITIHEESDSRDQRIMKIKGHSHHQSIYESSDLSPQSSNAYNSQQSQRQKNQSKKKTVYFSSQEYVQKVLQKYNQKSQIINESRVQEDTIQAQKTESILPRISEQNKKLTKSKSINPELEDYYSYRKFNKGKYHRVKSIGVFDSMALSIDSRAEEVSRGEDMGNSRGEKLESKLNKLFRYNKQGISSQNKNRETILPSSIVKNQKSITLNISTAKNMDSSNIKQAGKTDQVGKAQSLKVNKQNSNNISIMPQYTKEYLEQFVVKKTGKQAPKTSPKVQKSTAVKLQELQEKQQLIKEQLQPQLKIQTLFKTAADEYYKFKERNKPQTSMSGNYEYQYQGRESIHEEDELQESEQSSYRQNNQKGQEKPQETKSLTPANKKRLESLQLKEFDKKLIMDLFLNHYYFKKYLYDLIVSEFQPKTTNPLELNLEQVVKNFDRSGLFTDSRNKNI